MNIPTISNTYERQEIISDVAGYYAPSARELSEALAVVSCRDSLGVQQHFQEIFRRQQLNRVKKPENAIISVTREYLSYYRSAGSIANHLGALALDVNEIMNPNISLVDEIDKIYPKHRAFIRYVDLKNAYSDYSEEELQREVLARAYLSNNVSIDQYVLERLASIKIKHVRKLIPESIKDQKNRSGFWLDTLKRLRANQIAGPIIRSSLRIEP